MPDTIDVSPDSSSGAGDNEEPTAGASGSSPVTSDATPDSSRPLHNLKSEFDRKLEKMEGRFSTFESSLAEMMNVLATTLQARGKTPPGATDPETREYSDTELMELWQSGSKEAGDLLIDRKVDRKRATDRSADAASSYVTTQLRALYTKYPVLKDPTHPLTKAALATRSALVAAGVPATMAADLEAIKTAIADHPEIAAQVVQPPSEVLEESRREAADRVAGGGFGVSSRRGTEGGGKKKAALTKEQIALAQRMGVKDPTGARERMAKRSEAGKSGVSPILLSLLEERV